MSEARAVEFIGYSGQVSQPDQKPQWGHFTAEFMDEVQERFRRWLAEHDAKVRAEAYEAAEDAAANALQTWWLQETLPEDDTDSVMDVRRAIRAARQRREEQDHAS